MKKMMKKLIAMAAALVMIVTLLPAVGAKAEESSSTIDYEKKGSLTIKKTDENTAPLNGATFSIYKIASLDENGYELLVKTGIYQDAEDLLNLSSAQQEAAASAFAKAVVSNDYKDTVEKKQGTTDTDIDNDEMGVVTFEDLDLGYYLVIEDDVTEGYITGNPFFVAIPSANNASESKPSGSESTSATAWVYDVVAKPKNSGEPPVDKTTTNTELTTGVGDEIPYTITTVIPKYGTEYTNRTFNVYDIMTTGLALKRDTQGNVTAPSIAVSDDNDGLQSPTDYSISYINENNPDTKGVGNGVDKTFEIVFTDNYIKEHAGATVTITYTAVVTKDAVDVVGNKANVTYDRKPGVDKDATPAEVKKHTFGIDLSKYGVDTDSDGTRDLVDGAEFTLTDDNGAEIKFAYKEGTGLVIEGNNNVEMEADGGKLVITGLKPGTYKLTETKAPTGYTLLANPVTIVIEADETTGELESASVNGTELTEEELQGIENGIIPVNIENNKGFTLPSTGGMGTYLFTIGGIVIMAGAAFALIAMKKRA